MARLQSKVAWQGCMARLQSKVAVQRLKSQVAEQG